MLFYVILSLLALAGILIIFVRHFQQVGFQPKHFTQMLKDQFANWKQSRALRKVSAHKKRVENKTKGFFEDQTELIRDELWQQKSTEDICLMIEDALNQKQTKRALDFLSFLAEKYHEREVQEYLYSLFVMAHEQRGDTESALDYCNKLLEMSPGDTACMLKIAEFHARRGEDRQSEEILQRLIQMDQGNLEALDLLAGIYAKTFRMREAEELKRKVIALRMTKKT